MFCSNCGKQLPETAAFCDRCGTAVGTGVSKTGGVSELVSVVNGFDPESIRHYHRTVFVIVNTCASLIELLWCIPLFFKYVPLTAFFKEMYESGAERALDVIWEQYMLISIGTGAFILTMVICKSIWLYRVFYSGKYVKYTEFASIIRAVCLGLTDIAYVVFFEQLNGLALFIALMYTAIMIFEFVVNVKARNREVIETYRAKAALYERMSKEPERINRGPVKKVKLNSDGLWECEECGTFNPAAQNFCKDCGKYR